MQLILRPVAGQVAVLMGAPGGIGRGAALRLELPPPVERALTLGLAAAALTGLRPPGRGPGRGSRR